MRKKALVVLADGFEEIEAITPIDVLRRAGLEVTVAGLEKTDVPGAHGVIIKADILLKNYKDVPEVAVLPGGMPGAENLGNSNELKDLLLRINKSGKFIAAICAAPGLVLAKLGLLDHKSATCYPGFEKNFNSTTHFLTDRVVQDQNIITSRGPGSALEFSLKLVQLLAGAKPAGELTEGMLVSMV